MYRIIGNIEEIPSKTLGNAEQINFLFLSGLNAIRYTVHITPVE